MWCRCGYGEMGVHGVSVGARVGLPAQMLF